MKKKLLLSILSTLFLATVILDAKVTLCTVTGTCHEISRVQIEGVWHDACCPHFQVGISAGDYTCTDDCED